MKLQCAACGREGAVLCRNCIQLVSYTIIKCLKCASFSHFNEKAVFAAIDMENEVGKQVHAPVLGAMIFIPHCPNCKGKFSEALSEFAKEVKL